METASIILYVLAALIVTINTGVCALVARFTFLHTYTNGFVVSLAVSDLLTGAVYFPIYLQKVNTLLGFAETFILFTGIANICAVTFDRYTAITSSLVYYRKVSKYFAPIILASWVVPFLLSLHPLLWKMDVTTLSHRIFRWLLLTGGNILPCCVIFLAYIRMFRHVRRSSCLRQRYCLNRIHSRIRVRVERRVAKISAIASASLAFSWFPIFYTTIVTIFGKTNLIPQWLPVASNITTALASIVNPLLYSFMKPDFLRALRNLFYGRKLKRTPAMLRYRRSTSSSLKRPDSSNLQHFNKNIIVIRESSV